MSRDVTDIHGDQADFLSGEEEVSSIYYLDKIESLNFEMRVLGNGPVEYEVDYTTE